jgi:hypothetical protein
MRTDRQRYEDRHRRICQRSEEQFLAQRKKDPQFNVRLAITSYSLAIRAAIVRRDNSGIAACHAVASAHLALKFDPRKKPSGDARRQKKQHAQRVESERPTPSSLPPFRPHLGA